MPLPRTEQQLEAASQAGNGSPASPATPPSHAPPAADDDDAVTTDPHLEQQALRLVERQLARLDMEYDDTHEAKRWEAPDDPFAAATSSTQYSSVADSDDPWATPQTQDLIAAGCDPASLGYNSVEQIPDYEHMQALADDDSSDDEGEVWEWSADQHAQTATQQPDASTVSTATNTPTSSNSTSSSSDTPSTPTTATGSSMSTAAPLPADRRDRIKQIANSIELKPPAWARGLDDNAWRDRILQRAGYSGGRSLPQSQQPTAKTTGRKTRSNAPGDWVQFG